MLTEYLARACSAQVAAGIDLHLDACVDCRRVVAEFGRLFSGATESQPGVETGAESPWQPGSAVGRYTVIEPLGQGGMGVVLLAHDPELNRRVALKLVRPGSSGEHRGDGQARLLREAQAMARLSHPNVATVFDAGTVGDRIFIALELVEGQTLREWLRARPRTTREIVETFLEAGRGLLAAHRASIVHRDFKPDNVLIGADGRPRVTDFGLARSTTPAEEGAAPVSSTFAASAPELTRTVGLTGTPAYMAPELRAGLGASERSDQFAFCVSLYEALFGVRPYSSAALEGSAEWQPDKPTQPRRVRARLMKALLRGLSRRPEARFPSMERLLLELTRGVARRWPWVAAAGAGLSLAVVSAALARLPAPGLSCDGARALLAGAWDDDRQAAISAAFAASGHALAPAIWERTRANLERYALGWQRMHHEACVATRVRGDQSDQVLLLRMACLDRRRSDLAALADVLASADTTVVENALRASYGLPDLEGCSNLELLQKPFKPPESAAIAKAAERARARLSAARALNAAGRADQAAVRAEEALADLSAAGGYRPVEAEALDLLGYARMKAGNFELAEKAFRDAARAAERGGHDEVKASALIGLARMKTVQNHFEQADEWVRDAAATVERLGSRGLPLADLSYAQGMLESQASRPGWGESGYRRALTIRERIYGQDHPDVAAAAAGLADSLRLASKRDEARPLLQRAVASYQRSLGPDHLSTAGVLYLLAVLESETGNSVEAERLLAQAIEICERVAPHHPLLPEIQTLLARLEVKAGEYSSALARAQNALALNEVAFGKDSRPASLALQTIGHCLLGLNRAEEALRTLERVATLRRASLGAEHPEIGTVELSLAEAQMAVGRLAAAEQTLALARGRLSKAWPAESLPLTAAEEVGAELYLRQGRLSLAKASFERVLRLTQTLRGVEDPNLVSALIGLGKTKLQLSDAAGAAEALTRALALAEGKRLPLELLSSGRFALAKAQWALGGQKASARELAVQAQEGFRACKSSRLLTEAEAWSQTVSRR